MDLFEPVFSVRPTVVLRGRRHTHAIFLTNSHQLLVYLWFWFRQDLFDSSDLHISANTVRLWPNRIMVKWMCCGFQVRNEKSRQYPAVIITIALVHKFFFWSGGFVPFAYQIPRVPARARLSLSLCVCVCVYYRVVIRDEVQIRPVQIVIVKWIVSVSFLFCWFVLVSLGFSFAISYSSFHPHSSRVVFLGFSARTATLFHYHNVSRRQYSDLSVN